jgi:hypothetical protein
MAFFVRLEISDPKAAAEACSLRQSTWEFLDVSDTIYAQPIVAQKGLIFKLKNPTITTPPLAPLLVQALSP